MKLIDKDALVAEIERIKDEEIGIGLNAYEMGEENGKAEMCDKFLSFLNSIELKEIGVDLGDPKGDKSAKYIIDTKTIEVKEVDLEKEIEKYAYSLPHSVTGTTSYVSDIKSPKARMFGIKHDWSYKHVEQIAEHFYELGLKEQKGE